MIRARLERPDVRLVSLVGTGGTGKTRLALAAAAELSHSFADGVYFVDLAPIRNPDLVLPTLARWLGVRDSAQQPLVERLAEAGRDRRILVVLDNFEQVLVAAPRLAELLGMCPGPKLLVTSRAALRIRWEYALPLPPLPLESAVALFLERALAVRPDFTLTDTTEPAVAEICARLDGLPLAIELAAARLSVLSPAAILARLDHRLSLLNAMAADRPLRHQTLRAALDWSYNLLSKSEQRLFRSLAVFAGGCTLADVESVVGRASVDALTSLVDKSLLQSVESEVDGEPRFRLLETIREYALDHLSSNGELESCEQAHGVFFLRLAEQAEPELSGPQQEMWLKRLEAEQDNLRAALKWSQGTAGKADLALRLAAALWRFWWYHGHLSEGRAWLLAALSTTEMPTSVRAKALIGAGVMARDQGDYQAAAQHLDESLTVSRALEDKPGIAAALNGLGGLAAHLGDQVAARMYFEQSAAVKRELGDKYSLSVTLNNLGRVSVELGDLVRAQTLCEEGLRLYREVGDVEGIAIALDNLGDVALARRDFMLAAARYRESLNVFRTGGDRGGIAESLEGLAAVAAGQGQLKRAVQLLGASESLRNAVGAPLSPFDRVEHERTERAARAKLTDEQFGEARTSGLGMSLDEAVAYALARQEVDGGRAQSLASGRNELTRREQEVVELLGRGLTNRQIAQELVISERTAANHVEHVMGKLGLHTRAQVAIWVLEHGRVRAGSP